MGEDAGDDEGAAQDTARGHEFAEHEDTDQDDGDKLDIGKDRKAGSAKPRRQLKPAGDRRPELVANAPSPVKTIQK